MANIKISQMTSAGALTGAETVAGLQSGSNVGINVQDIADLAAGGTGLIWDKVTITSAQLLSMNTTLIDIVAAPGAGIAVLPYSVLLYYRFGTTEYLTNLNVILSPNNSIWNVAFNSALQGTQDRITSRSIFPTVSASGGNIDNQPLQVQVQTANPTAGDGTLDVYVAYYLLTL
jgi:hypothetical protein